MKRQNDAERTTEAYHPLSAGLDTLPLKEVVRHLWDDHHSVMSSIGSALCQITAVSCVYAETLRVGGCVFYVGAGTSGRLGFLDAAELPPTFGIPPDRVQAILAGGKAAISGAIEAAEDDKAAGRVAIVEHGVVPDDLVVGISASGRTPFVIGAIQEAKACGAHTASITNNLATPLEKLVDLPIVVLTGPELIAGSTRLKAGTAQKVVLNMLSTAAMVSLGKTYNGFMIGLRANNEKLRRRAVRTLTALTGQEPDMVKDMLAAADYEVDTALVMLTGNITHDEAKRLLQKYQGNVRRTLETLEHGTTGRK